MEEPTVDGRTRDQLERELLERAAGYTTDWDPGTADAGTTLISLFARFEEDVLRRLNGLPHKHRVAFLDALGFERRPPQSARVPLTFTTTTDMDGNAVVPGGTQATAEGDDGETVTFEIPRDEGFEATAATLTSVYSVAPESNSIHEHGDLLEDSDGAVTLFGGTDSQRHEFYIGHEDLLNVDGGSTVTLRMETGDGERIEEHVEWAYAAEHEEGSGWEPLPRETPDVLEGTLTEDVALEEKMRRVSDRIQQFDERERETGEEQYEPRFTVPGGTAPVTVAGTESRWIRGRVTGEDPAAFEIDIDSVTLDVESGADGREESRPSMVLSNDVPVSVTDGAFRPFGRMPQPPATLYIAAEDALTKHGGEVSVSFAAPEESPDGADTGDTADETEAVADGKGADDGGGQLMAERAGPLSGPPELSWEYWNGNGWTQLTLETDETDNFQSPGSVGFTVPEDLSATTVSGHEDFWIRARLVSGNYGQPQYEVTADGSRGRLVQRPDPPVFGDITLQYGRRGVTPDAVVTSNDAATRVEPVEPDEEPLTPFVGLPDGSQTLYLGFDAVLQEGPVNLHIPMLDKSYPRGFEPAVRWEYCRDPASGTWRKLDTYDGTEGLTERGIVSINFPSPTVPFERFGERRHWIRARVTREPFVTADEETDTEEPSGEDGRVYEHERTHTGRARGAEQESREPPAVSDIRLNTQWAYNERTVEETLGESDGSPGQTFHCSSTPITDASVWVDESGSMPESKQREFESTHPDRVRREQTSDGERFWVRWEEVSDFLDSGTESRHYRLNRTAGTVAFGDGQAGGIPPDGDGNVEAVYQTGGGSEGNLETGAITDLRSSVPHIDAVTNRSPSDGGTDVESLEETLSRAPTQLRNRGRAVSADDFEQIARESSRQLAMVRCEPEMDETGGQTPGWVTLLVIPRERRARPTPSLELRQRVREAVSERAPATLVGHDANRIIVRGPDYAELSVETTVETRGVESVTNLKNAVEGALSDFFHPLTGNRDGEGWSFGTAPRLSRLATLVESTAGVDRVRDISMTIEAGGEERIVRDPGKQPVLARDEMVSSGTHEVNVVMRGRR
jgi:uncharacterized phage protein gp47/JayE